MEEEKRNARLPKFNFRPKKLLIGIGSLGELSFLLPLAILMLDPIKWIKQKGRRRRRDHSKNRRELPFSNVWNVQF
jgi:hypothetical protein